MIITKTYDGLCCSDEGNILYKLINYNNGESYVSYSMDGGITFDVEYYIAENFVGSKIGCSSDGAFLIVGGFEYYDGVNYKPACYMSGNNGGIFNRVYMDTLNCDNTYFNDLKIFEQNNYIAIGGTVNNLTCYYAIIGKSNNYNFINLVLERIENINLSKSIVKNSKVAISYNFVNQTFLFNVLSFEIPASINTYNIYITYYEVNEDSSIFLYMTRTNLETLKPLPTSYTVEIDKTMDYITGFLYFNGNYFISLHVYPIILNEPDPSKQKDECGYIFTYTTKWVNLFYTNSNMMQTKITGKGFSGLSYSSNGLSVCSITNSIYNNISNDVYLSMNNFITNNITVCDSYNACNNIVITNQNLQNIKIFSMDFNGLLFNISNNDTTFNPSIKTMAIITLTYLKINITQKELFYFSKTLKLNPNIYKIKLLMRLNDRNDVINNDMFDIFTNSCFTLQTKEETIKSLELFNLFYGKNIIYYKTLLNFISCIRHVALNRNIEKKVKKLLKYLFCKITKKIKK